MPFTRSNWYLHSDAALACMHADEVSHFGGVEKHRRLTDYVSSLVVSRPR